MSTSTTQQQFRSALLDAHQSPPAGLVDPQGRPAGKRFDIYRNNVAVSLTEALRTAFPVIRQLLGDKNFDGLAGIFLRRHPPASPLLMFYGAEFPAFLEQSDQLAHLGYLPDVARLELALRQSYHAADSTPIAPTALQSLPPEDLMAARLGLAPALAVIRSHWPLHAIWQAHQPEGGPKPQMCAQDVLITRPDFDPRASLLPAGGAAFITALGAGATFGAALETAQNITPEFDLSATLGLLLSGEAIISIKTEATP